MMPPSKHSELTIVVTLPGHDQRKITGRVARMIAWLCDNQRQVERIKRGNKKPTREFKDGDFVKEEHPK